MTKKTSQGDAGKEKAVVPPAEPVFFATADAFGEWLAQHHESERELLVGYYKKGSGLPSMTWPESVDEALCYGWIDGVRKSRDADSYTIRFTPRKVGSIWSAVNIGRVEELTALGRMLPAGLRAFAARREDRSAVYSHEQAEEATLSAEEESRFRAEPEAWAFFEKQPPSYRKAAIWNIVSAKKEETRLRRLRTLIEESAAGRRTGQWTRSQ